jgi:hypothetical protein
MSGAALSPARVLLGWMDPEQGVRVLQGHAAAPDDAVQRVRAARERVASRPPGVDQSDAVASLPDALAAHVRALHQHPAAAEQLAGWTPSLVDLRRLCAVQSRVFLDHGHALAGAADPRNPASVAAVCLPTPQDQGFSAAFDEARKAWVLSSADPGLRVVSHFGRQIGPDVAGFGFGVALRPSYVKAVRHGGRWFLSDGYHRAIAFLRRGITHVPALVRTLADGEPLEAPHGMLPADAYLGGRPPCLPDFLDDEVALTVPMEVQRKVIIIQVIEVMA